jgi:hypothetical protein
MTAAMRGDEMFLTDTEPKLPTTCQVCRGPIVRDEEGDWCPCLDVGTPREDPVGYGLPDPPEQV